METKTDILLERCEVSVTGRYSNWNMVPQSPIFVEQAEGGYVLTTDGKSYLDLSNNWASVIHGHADPDIAAAASAAILKGACYSFPNPAEVELAEILRERVPSVEKVKFCGSGTMAAELAIKAAYAFTGRKKLVKLEGTFHGHFDPLFVSGPMMQNIDTWGAEERPRTVPTYRNMPDEFTANTFIIPANNSAAAEKIISEIGDDLAAIIIDPVPRQYGHIPLQREFAKTVRQLADRYKALLIVDEVMAFRSAYNGGQSLIDVVPDITMFGKIIGGGFPVAAIGGRTEVMSVFAGGAINSSVPIFGTFTANPVGLVAGATAMRKLTRESFERLESLGSYVRSNIDAIFKKHRLPGRATGTGSLFAVQFQDDEPVNFRQVIHRDPKTVELRSNMFKYMFDNGVLLDIPFYGAISLAMTEEDLSKFLNLFDAGLTSLKP